MSRFIRSAGSETTGGVDLSSCQINTSESITGSCFIGSGKTLCDTRWDLICEYKTGQTLNAGSVIQYDLPTHCYSEFYMRVSNYYGCCAISYISFGNSSCICCCCGQFCICCQQFTFSSSVTGYVNPCTSATPVCIPVYGCVQTTCNCISSGFELMLKQTRDGGICYDYNSLVSSTTPCALFSRQRGTVPPTSGMCTVWSSQVPCTSRFTRIVLCSSCAMTFQSDFCYDLYGLKNS